MPISHLKPDAFTDLLWATPTSGYGHDADEQPLPYLHVGSLELTPRFGGEPGSLPLAFQAVGLPYGFLGTGWPVSQRMFNTPRRRVNLYWKELLRSRCPKDGCFLFRDQLAFKATAEGFRGDSPLISFRRSFRVGAGVIEVRDSISFKVDLRFEPFFPLTIPLFPEWSIGTDSPRSLNLSESLGLVCAGDAISPTGRVILWQESIQNLSAQKGETLSRAYFYRWM